MNDCTREIEALRRDLARAKATIDTDFMMLSDAYSVVGQLEVEQRQLVELLRKKDEELAHLRAAAHELSVTRLYNTQLKHRVHEYHEALYNDIASVPDGEYTLQTLRTRMFQLIDHDEEAICPCS